MHATWPSKSSPYEHICIEFHIRNQTSGTLTFSSQAQPYLSQTSAVLHLQLHLGWVHPISLLDCTVHVQYDCRMQCLNTPACTGFSPLSSDSPGQDIVELSVLESEQCSVSQKPLGIMPFGHSAPHPAGQGRHTEELSPHRNLTCRMERK